MYILRYYFITNDIAVYVIGIKTYYILCSLIKFGKLLILIIVFYEIMSNNEYLDPCPFQWHELEVGYVQEWSLISIRYYIECNYKM